MEGMIKVCRSGEWVATGTPCNSAGADLVGLAPADAQVTFAADGRSQSFARPLPHTSVSKIGLNNCQFFNEYSDFETSDGQIIVSHFSNGPQVAIRATQLVALDNSARYDLTPGSYAIKPGKYHHWINGQTGAWDCANKTIVGESRVEYR
jgi:hypothetical protein